MFIVQATGGYPRVERQLQRKKFYKICPWTTMTKRYMAFKAARGHFEAASVQCFKDVFTLLWLNKLECFDSGEDV
jgi:hypothetical protein